MESKVGGGLIGTRDLRNVNPPVKDSIQAFEGHEKGSHLDNLELLPVSAITAGALTESSAAGSANRQAEKCMCCCVHSL